MLSVAQKHPTFVVPVPHVSDIDTPEAQSAEQQKTFEFYFMQWAFYEAPPVPVPGQTGGFPFTDPAPAPSAPPPTAPNPRTATILFTPLLEYKLRQTFATPYLILTFYPDLASSHDVVLMRGEITPRANSTPDEADFLLSQQDAQLLALAVQKFFLWTGGADGKEREALLKTFHEQPENFKWEDLLKHAGL
ncbi:hypothetical protein EWM64_g6223 [Hericium alpestre]|uniref:Uncharacterized protein n=1 Tax=Hericium alpestre TaxID=135208 RepID=A0A4Y9ZWC1_9AGAM|nr:hypothetical protein EWM64_g6223 [Hericium alpestre]